MYVEILKSKIHNVKVTDAQLNYVGSVTIDENLMDAAKLIPGEKVLIVNNNNGARLETYVIKGERGTGVICLNGAAARLVAKGDEVIIIAFCQVKEEVARDFRPTAIFPHSDNKEWKTNDDICVDLVIKSMNMRGEIDQSEIAKIALKMGRSVCEISELHEFLIKKAKGHE